jgi:hypothetical protein
MLGVPYERDGVLYDVIAPHLPSDAEHKGRPRPRAGADQFSELSHSASSSFAALARAAAHSISAPIAAMLSRGGDATPTASADTAAARMESRYGRHGEDYVIVERAEARYVPPTSGNAAYVPPAAEAASRQPPIETAPALRVVHASAAPMRAELEALVQLHEPAPAPETLGWAKRASPQAVEWQAVEWLGGADAEAAPSTVYIGSPETAPLVPSGDDDAALNDFSFVSSAVEANVDQSEESRPLSLSSPPRIPSDVPAPDAPAAPVSVEDASAAVAGEPLADDEQQDAAPTPTLRKRAGTPSAAAPRVKRARKPSAARE